MKMTDMSGYYFNLFLLFFVSFVLFVVKNVFRKYIEEL